MRFLDKRFSKSLQGSSGSGKSTIIGLLERWYDPSRGEISLDGTPLQNLNLQWLRTNMRLVQQVSSVHPATKVVATCEG